jgi:hypothetical protein
VADVGKGQLVGVQVDAGFVRLFDYNLSTNLSGFFAMAGPTNAYIPTLPARYATGIFVNASGTTNITVIYRGMGPSTVL